MTTSGSALVRVAGLTKRFGPVEVLKGIDLEVMHGQKVSLIGPSGSGKTTLIRCVNYLETPTSGHIFIDGVLIGETQAEGAFRPMNDRDLSRSRSRIGMVFQRFNLFPHLTVLENVMIGPLKVQKRQRDEVSDAACSLLNKMGLLNKRDSYPDMLSGGQQQRVAIARALALNPKLMLLDEPTSALDPELVGEVLAAIRQLADEGMTMIIVTHQMRFAESVSDQVVFMADGGIVEQGSPRQVLREPIEERTRSFLRALEDN